MLNVGVIQAVFRLNDQFTAALSLIERRLESFSRLNARIGSGFMAAGAAMTAGLTVPMTGLIKITSDFESAFANVIKTVEGLDVDAFGNLNEQAASLREEIRALAREIPITHEKLAGIAAVGGQFGVAAKDLGEFTDVVARLSVSIDGIDAENAAATLAQIQKIAKPTEENAFERMASTLVDLGNKGTSTEATILEMTRRISGAAATAGVATQDMFGLAAATANLGHESELGGTAISRTFLEISRAVAESGADLTNFAKVAGMSSQEFSEAWGQDAMGTLTGLLQKLGELDKSQLPSVLATLFGKDVRQSQVLTTLIRDFDGLTKTMKDARTEWVANQALAEESRKKFATFANQLQLFKNRLEDIGITLGGPVLTALRNTMDEAEPMLKFLEEMATRFENMDPKVQAVIVSLGLFASILGPILATVGAMVWGISQLGISLAGLLTALKVGAIIAFAAALAYLVYNFLEASGAIETAIKWGKAFGEMLLEVWEIVGKQAWGLLVDTGKLLWEILVDLYEILTIALQPLMDWAGHTNVLQLAMWLLKEVLVGALTGISEFLDSVKTVLTWIKSAAEWTERWVRALLQLRGIKLPDLPDSPPGAFAPRERNFGDDMRAGNRAAEGGMVQFNETLATMNALNMVGGAMTFGEDVAKEMAKPENAARRTGEALELAAKKSKALSEAQKIAAEQARNLAAALNAQHEAFMEAIGGAQVQKALQLMDTYELMLKRGIEPTREFMRELADETQGAMGVLATLKIPIPEKLQQVSETANQASFDLNRLAGVAIKVDFKEMSAGLDQVNENVLEFNANLRAARWDVLIEGATDKATKKLYEAGKKWEEALSKLAKGPPAGVQPKFWQQYVDIVNEAAAVEFTHAIGQTDAFRNSIMLLSTAFPQLLEILPPLDKVEKKAKKVKVEIHTFGEAIGNLASAFNELDQLHPLEGWIKDVATLASLMSVATKAGDALRLSLTRQTGETDAEGNLVVDDEGKPLREFNWDTLLGKNLDAGMSGVAKFAQAWINVAAAAMQAYAAMQQATDVGGKSQRIFQGAMTGAAIGAQIHPVYGTIIGFVIGGIWGAVRKLPWEEIGERIGYRMGVSVSEELSRAIQETAEREFGGQWHPAEISHIGDIIAEAGGLNRTNFGLFARELRDVFVMLETGQMNSAQAARVLNDNWDAFITAGTDGLGFINRQLREMLDLAGNFGLEVEAMKRFQQDQAGKVGDAFNTIGSMPTSFTHYQKIADNIAQARKEIEELNEEQERGTEWGAKMAKAQTMLANSLKDQAAAAATAAEEMNDLGTIGVASVMALVATGMTLNDAIRKAGPGLDSLIKAYENLGMTAEDPLVAMILRQREVQNAIPGVINGVDALGQSIVGLTNLGILNADTFGAIQRTAFRAYTSIQGEVAKLGGGTKDALLPMQTYLHQAEKAAKELGIPLDENTQMMIDQSKELGIWKDLGPTAAERTEAAMKNLTTAIENLTNALLGIPNEIPDPTRNWRDPNAPPIPPGPRQPNPNDNENETRAVGSRGASGRWFEQWDENNPVQLHGVEAVIRPDQAPAFAADVLGSMSSEPYRASSSGGGDQPIFLVLPDRRVLAQVVVEDMPDELRRRGIKSLQTF